MSSLFDLRIVAEIYGNAPAIRQKGSAPTIGANPLPCYHRTCVLWPLARYIGSAPVSGADGHGCLIHVDRRRKPVAARQSVQSGVQAVHVSGRPQSEGIV